MRMNIDQTKLRTITRRHFFRNCQVGLGALGLACLGAWGTFAWLVPHATGHAAANAWGWLPFGLAMGAVGIVGDLAESLIKRDVGCKDSSTWLPGFGGVLDILDSLLLAAPVAWACWALGLVGF